MELFEGLLHNSRSLSYRTPFGAVTCGARVWLRVDARPELRVRLRLWVDGGEVILEGKREDGGVSFFYAAPDHPCLVWYYFLLDTPQGLRYYGARTGIGVVYDYPPPAWQLTVYDAGFQTPDWFANAIAYQIFPDRFHRGGEGGGLDRLAYHKEMGRRVYRHESWEEDPVYGPVEGAKDYDPCDFFGGDLAGIREKLPYLKSLGVGVVYLNPIFESPSNHRYNTANYQKMDPVLGDDAALQALCDAAREAGIRIMLDGVFSHTGSDSLYFDRYGRYGGDGAYCREDSPYHSWYTFTAFPQNYKCWWGFRSLPEINELDPAYMEYISGVLRRYAGFGLTSWRLDVADELPDEFIAFLRRELKALDPEGVLLGEVWEDASNKEGFGARRKYVDGFELDSAMGYPFKDAVVDFLLFRTDAYGLNARLGALRENYPKPFYDAQLNLLSTHDTIRIQTVLSGAPGRDVLTRAEQAAYRPDETQRARGRRRQVLAVLLQFTLPGTPCIYYGDEAGMTGMADPFCRGTYPWGREDGELLELYRTVAAAHKRFRGTGCSFAALSPEVFAVQRGVSALCVVNRAESAQSVALSAGSFREGPDIPAAISGGYRDALTGSLLTAQGGAIYLVLPPLTGVLLLEERD